MLLEETGYAMDTKVADVHSGTEPIFRAGVAHYLPISLIEISYVVFCVLISVSL